MSDFTFITREQLFEDKEKLESIKSRGIKAAITDFSILLKGWVNNNHHVDGDDSLAGRTGGYFTKSNFDDFGEYVVSTLGNIIYMSKGDWETGARPVLPFLTVDEIPTNGVSVKEKDGIKYVEYGYYPQSAAEHKLQQELEQQFDNGKINKTGNVYTHLKKYSKDEEESKIQVYEEYEYKGKRYIRVKVNSVWEDEEEIKLSNGEVYEDDEDVWIKVEPIKWLIDEKEKIMITEKIVFAGVQFDDKKEKYHTEKFEKTNIYKFTNDIWAKEIEQVRSKRKKN